MITINVANTVVTLSDRDAYLTDYDWEVVDAGVILSLAARPDHLPTLRARSMLANILDDLGLTFSGFNDGNSFNLCRSNLVPVKVGLVGKRWCMFVWRRRVVSAPTEAEALEQRRAYYDD
jgi:hypothetical protein